MDAVVGLDADECQQQPCRKRLRPVPVQGRTRRILVLSDPGIEFGAAPQQAVRILARMNVGFLR